MDALYILGTGSVTDNDELRYSVRSLEKNMRDLRNVWVVGEKPNSIPRANHIPYADNFVEKWKNAYTKICEACKHPDISDEFLLMNDDFFMLEPFDGESFPFYTLKNVDGGTSGKKYFGIHCPMRIQKEWYLKMPNLLELKGQLSPRSFYGNFYNAPAKDTDDHILRYGENMPTPEEQTKKWAWFSLDNNALLDLRVLEYIATEWPIPSKWE